MSALRACLALTAQRETEEAANPIIYQVMIDIQDYRYYMYKINTYNIYVLLWQYMQNVFSINIHTNVVSIFYLNFILPVANIRFSNMYYLKHCHQFV